MLDDKKDIVILGCGGHAKSVCDTLLALSKQYKIAGFVGRERDVGFSYCGISMIGTDENLQDIYDRGIKYAVLGIGFLGHGELRNHLVKELYKLGFCFPVIVDPSAVVSRTAEIGEGTFVGKRVTINAGARIGRYCILNSCSLVEHDCQIGDFTHVAVSVCICGGVIIGRECLVGANATIIQNMNIADHCIVPAGDVIR